jgi:CBS domain-containing protein
MITRTIAECIEGRPLRTLQCNSTVADACRRLREYGVGALAVLDGTRLAGIISERDVTIRVIAGHRDPMLTLVREAMTRDPKTVPAHASVADALQHMLDGHYRHLPVMQGEDVVGMFSLRDIPTEYRLMYQRFREAHEVQSMG